jgi:hypothetical protein
MCFVYVNNIPVKQSKSTAMVDASSEANNALGINDAQMRAKAVNRMLRKACSVRLS